MKTLIQAAVVTLSAASTVQAQQAVQWKVSDGGNGHWYFVTPIAHEVCWSDFANSAMSVGAHLATATNANESNYLYGLSYWPGTQGFPSTYLGGYQLPDACEPGCDWRWVTGEPWEFTNWADLGCCTYDEDVLELCTANGGCGGRWRDDRACLPASIGVRAIYEWSADCNGDGIVDYGQILQSQLADTNQDGVPDICQQPTCVDADLFRDFNVNGADLGILLSQWGPNTTLTVSDINRDGAVDGSDLGILLSFWGACP